MSGERKPKTYAVLLTLEEMIATRDAVRGAHWICAHTSEGESKVLERVATFLQETILDASAVEGMEQGDS